MTRLARPGSAKRLKPRSSQSPTVTTLESVRLPGLPAILNREAMASMIASATPWPLPDPPNMTLSPSRINSAAVSASIILATDLPFPLLDPLHDMLRHHDELIVLIDRLDSRGGAPAFAVQRLHGVTDGHRIAEKNRFEKTHMVVAEGHGKKLVGLIERSCRDHAGRGGAVGED